jgi:hypothetical protein
MPTLITAGLTVLLLAGCATSPAKELAAIRAPKPVWQMPPGVSVIEPDTPLPENWGKPAAVVPTKLEI